MSSEASVAAAVEVPSPEMLPQFAMTPDQKKKRLELASSGGPVVQMMLGDAIGDAFGLGIELTCDAFWIRENVTCDKWPENLPQHWKFNNIRGMYSDDAEMTVGLMKGLMLEGVDIDEEGMLRAWMVEWDLAKQRPPPAEPGAERCGHGGFKYYAQGKSTLDDLRSRQASSDFPGNAPPMRALPLGFVKKEECERLCKANADTTHPHPKARAASYLIAVAARWLMVEHGDQLQVLQVARSALAASSLAESETDMHLEKIEALPDYHTYGERFSGMPNEIHSLLCGPQPCQMFKKTVGPDAEMHGIGSDAMRTAGVVLYLMKFHNGPRDVLMASVDFGGDVDSIAALTLAMVAGSVGLQVGQPGGVPEFLVEELEGVEYLVANARAFESWLQKKGIWSFDV